MQSIDADMDGTGIDCSSLPFLYLDMLDTCRLKLYVGSATMIVFDASFVGSFEVTFSADVSIAWNIFASVVLMSAELECRSKWIFPARRCSTSALVDIRCGYLKMFRYKTDMALMT